MSSLVKKAEEAMKKKNYDYTIDLCLQELRMKPDNIEARKLLREAARERLQKKGGSGGGSIGSKLGMAFGGLTKNYDKVILACEEYLKTAPNDTACLLKLGQAAQKAGYVETAIYVLRDIIQIDKKYTPALRALAQLHRERDEIDEAANCYELIRKADPADKEANKAVRELAAMSSSRKMDKAREEGEGDFRSLIKDKDKAKNLEKEGRILRTDDEIQEAIQESEAEAKKNPKDHKIFLRLGDLYSRIRQYEKSIESYEKANAINDSDGTVLNTIGDLRLKQYNDEIKDLDAQLKKSKDEELSSKRKKLLAEKVKFCIEEWRRRVEAYPTEASYKYELGRYLFQGNKTDDAIAMLQKALDDPRNARNVHNLLGQCFMKKKVHDLALKEFRKGLDGLSSSEKLYKEITYNIAQTYENMGDVENAKNEYGRILEIDYNFKDVAQKVEQLQS